MITLLPTPTIQQQNHKRKREMCEPQIMKPSSFQLQPKTPPHILQRMKTDTCYHCKQQGHWSRDCPHKSHNNNNSDKSPSSSVPSIYCRCGHGFCVVKTSGSIRNPGREFFACPIKRGAPCECFKWCDDPIEKSYFQPPLFKYPFCECGAGVCRKDIDIHYFVCPIKKGRGSCGFRVSEQELKMRVNDNPENHSPAMVVSAIPVVNDGESPMEEVNAQHNGFPELKFDDDDLYFTQVPWDERGSRDYFCNVRSFRI